MVPDMVNGGGERVDIEYKGLSHLSIYLDVAIVLTDPAICTKSALCRATRAFDKPR